MSRNPNKLRLCDVPPESKVLFKKLGADERARRKEMTPQGPQARRKAARQRAAEGAK